MAGRHGPIGGPMESSGGNPRSKAKKASERKQKKPRCSTYGQTKQQIPRFQHIIAQFGGMVWMLQATNSPTRTRLKRKGSL